MMPRLCCIPLVLCGALAACGARSAPPVTGAVPVPPVTPPAITAVTGSPQFTLQRFVDSLVAQPQFSSAHWGILVVAPERREPLASVNADMLVMPASNMKLVTAAVALAQLGADFRWRTTFVRTGPIVRGVLHGDIVVHGTGDPSISVAMRGDPVTAFAPLVDSLKAAGVRRVVGRVRSADSVAFPGSPLGFGWDWDDLNEAYGAGVSELLFNEAFTDVIVTGCRRVGAKACVSSLPLRTSPIVHSEVVTRAAGSGPPQLQWWRDSSAVPRIAIRGSIAAGDSARFSAAQPDTRGTYIAAVMEALNRGGITVAAGTRARRGHAVTTVSDTLCTLQSAELRDVLKAMQKPSQNQIAEALFRTIGLQATGVGTPDSARVVVERQLAAWAVRSDAYAIRDGSGLSRHDYLTPSALVRVLSEVRTYQFFPAYVDALPIAGIDGTLRNRMKAVAPGRVRAKTGTIDKARALSGYVTTADGQLLIFSIIANNFTVPNREVDRTAEAIVERLVNMRQTTP